MYRIVGDPGTFMHWPRTAVSELTPGMVALGGLPIDVTGESQSQRFGPESIRKASHLLHRYYVGEGQGGVVNVRTGRQMTSPVRPEYVDIGNVEIWDTQMDRTNANIIEWMREITSRGAFPICLGGDHWTTAPLFTGYHDAVRAAGQDRIGYIHVDAHLDLEESEHGDYWSGSTGVIIERLAGLHGENMVFLGQSAEVWRSEWNWLSDHGATLISADEVNDIGIDAAVHKASRIAGRGTDSTYLTVDIDVINTSDSQGTMAGSTFWGISARDFGRMLDLFGADPTIGAVDFMEMAPDYDPHGSTAWLVARCIIGLLDHRAERIDAFHTAMQSGDQHSDRLSAALL